LQWLTAESARILHTLRHIDAINKAGDAAEVLRALWRVKDLLDGAVESAHMLWTWQDLFKVCQRVAVHWLFYSRLLSAHSFSRACITSGA
jgi:hypothetical protein